MSEEEAEMKIHKGVSVTSGYPTEHITVTIVTWSIFKFEKMVKVSFSIILFELTSFINLTRFLLQF